MANDHFTGNGYSTDEFTPDERSRHRHLFYKLNDNFIILSDEDLKTVKAITPVRKAWPIVVTAFGLAVTAVKQGLI